MATQAAKQFYEENKNKDTSRKVVMCSQCNEIIIQQTVEDHYKYKHNTLNFMNVPQPIHVAVKDRKKDIYEWVPVPRTQIYAERMGEYATEHSEYTTTVENGRDNNKKNKFDKAISRGKQSYTSRQCSAHIRTVYPKTILQDGENTEFCVNSRIPSAPENQCNLCHIENDPKWIPLSDPIGFDEAIGGAADMAYNLGTNYPKHKECTLLRIKKNGKVIIEYYIKLIFESTMIKTASPSGNKYTDRMSVSKYSKIQANNDKDIIFCITGDCVHGVTFWNLLKNGGIRLLLQLHKEQIEQEQRCGFYVLADKNSTDIKTIDVELVVNRNGMKNKMKPLWHYEPGQHLLRNEPNNIQGVIDNQQQQPPQFVDQSYSSYNDGYNSPQSPSIIYRQQPQQHLPRNEHNDNQKQQSPQFVDQSYSSYNDCYYLPPSQQYIPEQIACAQQPQQPQQPQQQADNQNIIVNQQQQSYPSHNPGCNSAGAYTNNYIQSPQSIISAPSIISPQQSQQQQQTVTYNGRDILYPQYPQQIQHRYALSKSSTYHVQSTRHNPLFHDTSSQQSQFAVNNDDLFSVSMDSVVSINGFSLPHFDNDSIM